MYNKIFNTETNNFENIDTKEGKLILRNYINYIKRHYNYTNLSGGGAAFGDVAVIVDPESKNKKKKIEKKIVKKEKDRVKMGKEIESIVSDIIANATSRGESEREEKERKREEHFSSEAAEYIKGYHIQKYIENKDKNIYYADHNHLKFRHGPGILSADRQSTLVHDNHFIPHDPFKLNDNDIKQNLLISQKLEIIPDHINIIELIDHISSLANKFRPSLETYETYEDSEQFTVSLKTNDIDYINQLVNIIYKINYYIIDYAKFKIKKEVNEKLNVFNNRFPIVEHDAKDNLKKHNDIIRGMMKEAISKLANLEDYFFISDGYLELLDPVDKLIHCINKMSKYFGGTMWKSNSTNLLVFESILKTNKGGIDNTLYNDIGFITHNLPGKLDPKFNVNIVIFTAYKYINIFSGLVNYISRDRNCASNAKDKDFYCAGKDISGIQKFLIYPQVKVGHLNSHNRFDENSCINNNGQIYIIKFLNLATNTHDQITPKRTEDLNTILNNIKKHKYLYDNCFAAREKQLRFDRGYCNQFWKDTPGSDTFDHIFAIRLVKEQVNECNIIINLLDNYINDSSDDNLLKIKIYVDNNIFNKKKECLFNNHKYIIDQVFSNDNILDIESIIDKIPDTCDELKELMNNYLYLYKNFKYQYDLSIGNKRAGKKLLLDRMELVFKDDDNSNHLGFKSLKKKLNEKNIPDEVIYYSIYNTNFINNTDYVKIDRDALPSSTELDKFIVKQNTYAASVFAAQFIKNEGVKVNNLKDVSLDDPHDDNKDTEFNTYINQRIKDHHQATDALEPTRINFNNIMPSHDDFYTLSKYKNGTRLIFLKKRFNLNDGEISLLDCIFMHVEARNSSPSVNSYMEWYKKYLPKGVGGGSFEDTVVVGCNIINDVDNELEGLDLLLDDKISIRKFLEPVIDLLAGHIGGIIVRRVLERRARVAAMMMNTEDNIVTDMLTKKEEAARWVTKRNIKNGWKNQNGKWYGWVTEILTPSKMYITIMNLFKEHWPNYIDKVEEAKNSCITILTKAIDYTRYIFKDPEANDPRRLPTCPDNVHYNQWLLLDRDERWQMVGMDNEISITVDESMLITKDSIEPTRPEKIHVIRAGMHVIKSFYDFTNYKVNNIIYVEQVCNYLCKLIYNYMKYRNLRYLHHSNVDWRNLIDKELNYESESNKTKLNKYISMDYWRNLEKHYINWDKADDYRNMDKIRNRDLADTQSHGSLLIMLDKKNKYLKRDQLNLLKKNSIFYNYISVLSSTFLKEYISFFLLNQYIKTFWKGEYDNIIKNFVEINRDLSIFRITKCVTNTNIMKIYEKRNLTVLSNANNIVFNKFYDFNNHVFYNYDIEDSNTYTYNGNRDKEMENIWKKYVNGFNSYNNLYLNEYSDLIQSHKDNPMKELQSFYNIDLNYTQKISNIIYDGYNVEDTLFSHLVYNKNDIEPKIRNTINRIYDPNDKELLGLERLDEYKDHYVRISKIEKIYNWVIKRSNLNITICMKNFIEDINKAEKEINFWIIKHKYMERIDEKQPLTLSYDTSEDNYYYTLFNEYFEKLTTDIPTTTSPMTTTTKNEIIDRIAYKLKLLEIKIKKLNNDYNNGKEDLNHKTNIYLTIIFYDSLYLILNCFYDLFYPSILSETEKLIDIDIRKHVRNYYHTIYFKYNDIITNMSSKPLGLEFIKDIITESYSLYEVSPTILFLKDMLDVLNGNLSTAGDKYPYNKVLDEKLDIAYIEIDREMTTKRGDSEEKKQNLKRYRDNLVELRAIEGIGKNNGEGKWPVTGTLEQKRLNWHRCRRQMTEYLLKIKHLSKAVRQPSEKWDAKMNKRNELRNAMASDNWWFQYIGEIRNESSEFLENLDKIKNKIKENRKINELSGGGQQSNINQFATLLLDTNEDEEEELTDEELTDDEGFNEDEELTDEELYYDEQKSYFDCAALEEPPRSQADGNANENERRERERDINLTKLRNKKSIAFCKEIMKNSFNIQNSNNEFTEILGNPDKEYLDSIFTKIKKKKDGNDISKDSELFKKYGNISYLNYNEAVLMNKHIEKKFLIEKQKFTDEINNETIRIRKFFDYFPIEFTNREQSKIVEHTINVYKNNYILNSKANDNHFLFIIRNICIINEMIFIPSNQIAILEKALNLPDDGSSLLSKSTSLTKERLNLVLTDLKNPSSNELDLNDYLFGINEKNIWEVWNSLPISRQMSVKGRKEQVTGSAYLIDVYTEFIREFIKKLSNYNLTSREVWDKEISGYQYQISDLGFIDINQIRSTVEKIKLIPKDEFVSQSNQINVEIILFIVTFSYFKKYLEKVKNVKITKNNVNKKSGIIIIPKKVIFNIRHYEEILEGRKEWDEEEEGDFFWVD